MSDFSCYVQIANNSAHTLTVSTQSQSGSWQGDVPNTIPPHDTFGYMRLEDPSGPYGSQGSITFGVQGGGAWFTVDLEDPYSGENSADLQSEAFTSTMSASFEGATGDPSGFEPGSVPSGGHPVYVNVTFADSAGG